MDDDFIKEAEDLLKLKFKNKNTLLAAITHKSCHDFNSDEINSEKLEFLGDSIVNSVIAEQVFIKYPHLPEGDMTKLRSNLVNTRTLSEIAKKIKLDKIIRLSENADRDGARKLPSVLENSFESLIGAIYLNDGFDFAKDYINNLFEDKTEELYNADSFSDYKSILQEKVAKIFNNILPIYEIVGETGPVHDKTFSSKVSVSTPKGHKSSLGTGKSKKKAELNAAKKLLKTIDSILCL